MRAIQWNLHYYYNGCVSWSWFYPHHYSPWITDIKDFASMDLTFEKGDPFLPFENLFCAICMGGVFDVIQETFYGKPKTSEENGDAVKPKSGEIIHKLFLHFLFCIF